MRIFIVTDRGFHGDRLFGDLQYLADLVLRHFHALAQLFRGRLTTHFLQHLPGNAVELVDRFDHVHRNTNGACLVGDGASDRLTNPPGGIGRELVALGVVELLDGADQAQVAFLDQVQELQATVGVLLGDGDHQTQVRLDHFFLGAASLGFANRHATVDFLDFGNGQAGFGLKVDQFLLARNDSCVFFTQGRSPFSVALGKVTAPGLVGFVAWEHAQEVGTRHAGITHAQLHDGALLLTQAAQCAANALDQHFELLGYQLDRHEQIGQCLQGSNAFLVITAVLLQDLVGGLKLIGYRAEALGRNDRVRTAFGLFFVVTVGLFFLVLGLFLRSGSLGAWNRHFLCRCCDVVIGIDVTTEDVRQTATFGGDAVVLAENVIDSAREVGDGAHDFTNAFLDPLGDFDLAFTGQQLDRAHFTHVHAYRVGRAADIGLNCRQRSSGFFGRGFVGVGFRQQKGIRIRSTLEYVDPHVVDHADDVFHLFRI